ncbi:MAG: hypothetical protein VX589_19370 [Myxococcota bacterium]|nr:hypothetical protein [Myxococcota bacterium]
MTKLKDNKAPVPQPAQNDENENDAEGNEVVKTVLEMAAIPFFVDEEAAERAGLLTPAITEFAPAGSEEDDEDDDDDTIRLEEEIFDEENLTENED